MKASELRIGNYVYEEDVKYKTSTGHTEILGLGIWKFQCEKMNLHPIPLTEEWLLKFGFIKGVSDDDQERITYSIQVANNTSLYFDRHKDWMRNDLEVEWYLSHEWNNNHFKNNFWNSPKYVHQLQNLYFALTGEELHL